MKRSIISAAVVGATIMTVNAVGATTASAACVEGRFAVHLWLNSTCIAMMSGQLGYYFKEEAFGGIAEHMQCDEVEAGEASEYATEAACLKNETKAGTGGWERSYVGCTSGGAGPAKALPANKEPPAGQPLFTGTAKSADIQEVKFELVVKQPEWLFPGGVTSLTT